LGYVFNALTDGSKNPRCSWSLFLPLNFHDGIPKILHSLLKILAACIWHLPSLIVILVHADVRMEHQYRQRLLLSGNTLHS
jgi:hypothetical protein